MSHHLQLHCSVRLSVTISKKNISHRNTGKQQRAPGWETPGLSVFGTQPLLLFGRRLGNLVLLTVTAQALRLRLQLNPARWQ